MAAYPPARAWRCARVRSRWFSAVALLAERAPGRPHVLRDRALGHLRAGHQGAEALVEGVDVLAGQISRKAHQRGAHFPDGQLALVVADDPVVDRGVADDLGQALLL